MKKTILKVAAGMMLSLFSLNVDAAVEIIKTQGWFESGYVTWKPLQNASGYNVFYKASGASDWTKVDNELVRNYGSYGRADMVGLSAGTYQFMVVPIIDGSEKKDEAAESGLFTAVAYDRAGFAHQGVSNGVGAYKNDGTLKDGARVVYIYANNAKTVKCNVITDTKKGTTTECVGWQTILDTYMKGKDSTPITFRIIGTVKLADLDHISSSAEGLQVKNNGSNDFNMTIEGIGDDATIWGFGILARAVKNVEFRNFAVMNFMDDALSLDTDNQHVWIHNMDFFYGKTGGDSDQAKGDGTVDIKGKSTYITVAYNHFFDSGKSSLGGMSGEVTSSVLTYHHNWFDHSDSRHPRIRTSYFHIYNNYFDGNSKYGVGMTSGGSAFVEKNYFRNCKYPMLISLQGTDGKGDGTFSGEPGGVIKSFANKIVNAKRCNFYSDANASTSDWDAYEVKAASDAVPSTVVCKGGGTSYLNYDTDGTLAYTYVADEAENVPEIVMANAGRMGQGDFKWQFNNAVEDENYAVISALKKEVENYKSSLVGFFDSSLPAEVGNGGYAEGDRSGGDAVKNADYVPGYVSGGGSSSSTDVSLFLGGADGGYYWFNAGNDSKTKQLIADGAIVLNDASYSADATATDDTKSGALLLQKSTGKATFYCPDGIEQISFLLFRTGSLAGKILAGNSLDNLQEQSSYSEKKKGEYDENFSLSGSPKYVQITNTATGGLYVHGVKIFTANTTTAVSAPIKTVENDVKYNLSGRRIQNPAKGEIYILNGKKYVAQ